MTARPHGADRILRRTELLLWLVGALCVAVCSLTGVRVLAARRQAEAIVRPSPGTFASSTVPVVAAGVRTKPGATVVMGRLEIPQISLSVPVMADFDPESLLRGVGHIQGTALPGGLGTMGLAGHRDTFFRPLRRVAPRMDIRVADGTGTYHYEVDSTEVVTPEQVEVLEIRSRPELTLITCYPFDFIGAAPKRFIVHAHLLSASPDPE